MERADKLIDRLIRQRNMCLDSFIKQVDSAADQLGDKFPYDRKPRRKEATEIMSAFQAVHVLSFINMKHYIEPDKIGDFTRYVSAYLFEGDHEVCINYVHRYTELKQQKLAEQWVTFGEDVAMVIVGAPSGLFIGPVLAETAIEFTYRMWGITADTFDDKATVSEMAGALSKMHVK